jgi:arginine exporter protein ArgO|nr:MAG TPA: hypothetical protein [Crassvirales sp.]
MLFVLILMGVLVISTFVRYHPYLDLVLSYDRYILLLWYDKDGGRTYIKLLEI